MALILNRSIMIHVPKTGGTWTYVALREQGLVRGMLWSADNNPHPCADEVAVLFPRFTFCFVRRPVAWLRSYWASAFIHRGYGIDRVRFGSSPWAEFAQCEAPSFLEFCTAYLERCPGAVGRMFDRYVKGVDFVGKHESLIPDLCRALEIAGESFDADRLAESKPENQSSRFPLGPLAEIPDAIANEIRRAELPLLQKFYPSIAETVS
jgi:hypothetical protein